MSDQTETPMDRIRAKAEAQALVVDRVAAILWANGPELADWEDGSAPTWEDVTRGRQTGHDAWASCWLETRHQAEALLAIQPKDAMVLAMILMEKAAAEFEDHQLELWRKVERAAGFERGSLTGKDGVTQRVFL